METKNILIGLAGILVLGGLVYGAVYLIRRDGEAANNAQYEATAESNTTEPNTNTTEREERKIRILPIDTFLIRLNRDLGRLERMIETERKNLESKIAELVLSNAEAKTRIGDLKATYDELSKEQKAELDDLIKEVRENRELIATQNEAIEVLDAKQTIIDETRKEKSSMTAGELGLRAVEIDGFIRALEAEEE